MAKNERKMEVFVDQCVRFCKSAKMSSKEEIFNWLNADLQKDYEGRASKWKIESVAEDITESICLKMNIDQ